MMAYSLTVSTTPNRSWRAGHPIYLVTHHTQGGYDGSVSWLKSPRAQASADEVISTDGSRVTVLNDPRSGYKTWEVGNANDLCVGFELEGFVGQTVFPDSLYETLAKRLLIAQQHVHDKYGFTIPLKHSATRGTPGIVSHRQVAQWYGGSDHTDGDINWGKLGAALSAATNPQPHSWNVVYTNPEGRVATAHTAHPALYAGAHPLMFRRGAVHFYRVMK